VRLFEGFENIVFRDTLVIRYQPQDGIQGSNPQGIMVRNRHPLMPWILGIENDMTSRLMHGAITPVLAEAVSQFPS